MTEPTTVHVHPMTPEGAIDLIHELIRQRDQARRIAAILEAECARCWGPIHKEVLEQIRLDSSYAEGVNDDGA